MIEKIDISNFKSIIETSIELGNTNVFIGENGCGKTNILEAIAMLSASKDNNLNINGLSSRGVRVTKPSLTISSFIGKRQKNEIELSAKFSSDEGFIKSCLFPEDINDIYSDWKDKDTDEMAGMLDEVLKNKLKDIDLVKLLNDKSQFSDVFKEFFLKNIPENRIYLTKFLIFNLNTQSLRGISNNSKEIPLGINGEGLDLLLHDFSEKEWNELKQYSYLIEWLADIVVDEDDKLKYKGHKLGRSSSFLYFKDKYMRKNNNVFAAENSNEGVLNILFYLALMISKKTPDFFAIDNVEASLNPKLCRTLMKIMANLSIKKKKQVLVTTHNPAILDGLNLLDDTQRLFVVKRTDEGYTKIERVRLKPTVKGKELKLSEMWMRGYLGGLPNNF